MKAYIQKTIDYTLKRKGEIAYLVVDENKNFIPTTGGYWKTKKAAMTRLNEKGLEYVGTFTVHQCYSHWQNFTPATLDGWTA